MESAKRSFALSFMNLNVYCYNYYCKSPSVRQSVFWARVTYIYIYMYGTACALHSNLSNPTWFSYVARRLVSSFLQKPCVRPVWICRHRQPIGKAAQDDFSHTATMASVHLLGVGATHSSSSGFQTSATVQDARAEAYLPLHAVL